MRRPLPPRVELLESRENPATITVTTLTDVVDGDVTNPAALAASPGGDGVVSLAEAFRAADGDLAADTIVFDPSLAGGTVGLTGSTLDPRSAPTDAGSTGASEFVVTTPITLQGSGQVIERTGARGQPEFRFFHVRKGGSLTIDRVELHGGLARGGNGAGGGGGAAGLGGAVFNESTLVITNSTLTGNRAVGGDGGTFSESFQGGGGGGLAEDASVEGGDGGGPNGGFGNGEGSGGAGGFGGGGGGASGTGGAGGFGGGGGASAFSPGGNGGFGAGAGVGFGNGSGSGSGATAGFGGLDAAGSFGGSGAGMGGAVFNLGGNVRIANSTIVGNTAVGGVSGDGESTADGLGGGVFNLNGTVSVASSTFAGNRADDGGAAYNLEFPATQGVSFTATARLTLRNSIFVDSTDPAATGPSTAEVVNRHENPIASTATLTATDPNVTNQGGFRNDGGIATTTGLRTATRPVVAAALADNGGPTRTLLPTADSEAVDVGGTAAPDDGQGSGVGLTTDQRGLPRISGAGYDLGAVELRAAQPPGRSPDALAFTSPTGVSVRNVPAGTAPQTDPYPWFGGDNRVAVADLDGDGFVEFIYAPGVGGGPHIRVIDGATGAERQSFFSYAADFRGGVFLAVADVNGDGQLDVVTSAGDGGGPHVKAFDGRTGAELASFFADDPTGRGGVTVAAGDVTGDGRADIVTGAGVNGNGLVQVIDGTKLNQLGADGRILPSAVAASFAPFGGPFAGGIAVAVGNFTGDRFADVAAGPLTRAAPQVSVRSGPDLAVVASFPASVGAGLDTGLRMVAADDNADGLDELVVIAGPGGGPHTELIDPLTGTVLDSFFTFDPSSRTGFDVG
ncbi:MAG: VCBS repeat-containing protein [Gemmataceae bacterium]